MNFVHDPDLDFIHPEPTMWDLADHLRPVFMLGLPCHDDPILNGGDLNDPRPTWHNGKPCPNTHGRPPIEAFPVWYAGQFGFFILDT